MLTDKEKQVLRIALAQYAEGNSIVEKIDAVISDAASLSASLSALTVNFNALLVKLDADSGDTGGDSDYEATLAI